MRVKDEVEQWLLDNEIRDYVVTRFSAGDKAGSVANQLRDLAGFPYTRDHLEIWRRASCPERDPVETNYHFPDLAPAEPIMRPARLPGPRLLPDTPTTEPLGKQFQLIAIFPDQQAPHHDPHLDEMANRWLDHNKPDGLVYLGDAIDLPSLSHYRRNPYMVGGDRAAALQLGLDTTYELFRNNMQAAGPTCTYRKYLPGNHEQRLMNYLLDNAEALFGVRRAGGGEPVVTLEYLLRLDELGIDFVRHPNGEWPNASLALTDHLAARHGWLVRQNSAATAHATLRHLGHSVIVGHTHRQGTAYWTQTELSGATRVHVGVEAGTMALPELGYAPAPDWQQGFVVVRIFPDQQFSIAHANYVNHTLIWEGQRFSESARGISIAA